MPDLVAMRAYVIRQLAKGRTCSEIEDDFIRHGHPVDRTIQFVSGTYRAGRGGGNVTGTYTEFNDGTMVQFNEDVTSKMSRRAAGRHRREIARAREENDPTGLDPSLQELSAPLARQLQRVRGNHARTLFIAAIGVIVVAAGLSVLLFLTVP